jgi:HlyD family secretion protein
MAEAPMRFAERVLRPVARPQSDELPLDLVDFTSPSMGLILAPVPLAARRIAWTIVSLCLACLIAAALIPIDQVVTGPGEVVSLTPTIVLQPFDTAIVRAIKVHEGERVAKGTLLATLDPTLSASDEAQYRAQVRGYGAQVARDQAELDGAIYTAVPGDPDSALQAMIFNQRHAALQAQMDEYDQKIASLKETHDRAVSDAQGYAQRVGIAADVESIRKELERLTVGARLNTLTATDNRLEMARQLQNTLALVQSSEHDIQAQVKDREYYLQNWRAQTTQDLTTAVINLANAQSSLEKALLRHQLVEMRAPQDSVVLTVAKVSVGSVLAPSDQLMTLIPSDAKLQVSANVLGDDIGFVRLGQPVTIKFNTFSFIRYGDGEGTVQSISPDAFVSPNGAGPNSQVGGISAAGTAAGAPVTTAQQQGGAVANSLSAGLNPMSYYRTGISIDKLALKDVPAGFKLLPGLPVSVDVKVGKSTVLSYLLGRAAPEFTEGMREP